MARKYLVLRLTLGLLSILPVPVFTSADVNETTTKIPFRAITAIKATSGTTGPIATIATNATTAIKATSGTTPPIAITGTKAITAATATKAINGTTAITATKATSGITAPTATKITTATSGITAPTATKITTATSGIKAPTATKITTATSGSKAPTATKTTTATKATTVTKTITATKAPIPNKKPISIIQEAEKFSFDLHNICYYQPLPPHIYVYYYSRNFPEGKLMNLTSPMSYIFPSTETKVLTHGFKSNLKVPEFLQVIKAYLNLKSNINILAIDWSYYTNGKYRQAALYTRKVGESLSPLFCVLQKFYDIYPQQIHFIGHNLGAHLLAFTARRAVKKVGRITGLDPAGFCFEEECSKFHLPQLSEPDANFVDILHTNAGKFGTLYNHGTADFYPNGGFHQPRCRKMQTFLILNHCDSLSALLYFAESIARPNAFRGILCYNRFPKAKCFTNLRTTWGEHMKPFASGTYFFHTNARPYYGQGIF